MKAVVDNHCFSDNPLERIKGTNEIMCVLFPYIEKYLMMDDKEQKNYSNSFRLTILQIYSVLAQVYPIRKITSAWRFVR